MKRKRINALIIAFFFSFFFVWISCKKYPKGGNLNQAHKNLRHNWNNNYEKLWEVKLVEVEGVDSTAFFNKVSHSIGSSSDFRGFDVRIKGFAFEKNEFELETAIYKYKVLLNTNKDSLFFTKKLFGLSSDSLYYGYYCPSSKNDCQRNIFIPEPIGKAYFAWKIHKLTKNSLIISALKNKYRLELRWHDDSV